MTDILESANLAYAAAVKVAEQHGHNCMVIVVGKDGGFQMISPSINRSLAVGVLFRATHLYCDRMEQSDEPATGVNASGAESHSGPT